MHVFCKAASEIYKISALSDCQTKYLHHYYTNRKRQSFAVCIHMANGAFMRLSLLLISYSWRASRRRRRRGIRRFLAKTRE